MAKNAAFGTKLQMGDGATPTESFTEIAGVTNIGGPGITLDTEDVTTHDSTGAWEQIVPTILRTGEISLDIVYDPVGGTHDATTGLVKQAESKTSANYKLIFPDTAHTEWSFAAYVTSFEPGAPADGALTASVKLKINGIPTLA